MNINKDIEVFSIGYIKFSNPINESEISFRESLNVKSLGECKIEVYANEGQVPHFHLFNKDKSFETCICIFSNNYFSHGRKYTDKLSKNQCKELDDYLRSSSKSFENISVWQTIVIGWETGNPNCKFPETRKVKEQPKYIDMTDYRDI